MSSAVADARRHAPRADCTDAEDGGVIRQVVRAAAGPRTPAQRAEAKARGYAYPPPRGSRVTIHYTSRLRNYTSEAMDLSEATVAAGYSKDGAIGSKGGLIGALTRGRVTRRDYTIQAIRMALTEREPRASRGLPAASLRNTVADTEA